MLVSVGALRVVAGQVADRLFGLPQSDEQEFGTAVRDAVRAEDADLIDCQTASALRRRAVERPGEAARVPIVCSFSKTMLPILRRMDECP